MAVSQREMGKVHPMVNITIFLSTVMHPRKYSGIDANPINDDSSQIRNIISR
jgi:hypothetical protein